VVWPLSLQFKRSVVCFKCNVVVKCGEKCGVVKRSVVSGVNWSKAVTHGPPYVLEATIRLTKQAVVRKRARRQADVT